MQRMKESGCRPKTTPKFWKEVSRLMDHTRTAQQCSNKWYVLSERLATAELTTIFQGSRVEYSSLA